MKKTNFFKSKYSFSKIKNSIKYRLENNLFFEQWFLIYNFEEQRITKPLKDFQKIIPPKDRFWADPHVIYKNSNYYVFFEEFIINQNKGHISYFKINEKGNYSNVKKILEQPFHLSYPFIFQYDNEMYMIPETQERKSIQLYKCLEFPEKWIFEKDLLTNIDAADSTIFNHNDKWWIFTGVRKNKESGWDNLHIFYANNPISHEWVPHPQNLITEKQSNSRPAGAIFRENNEIHRPVQISTFEEYGRAIVINRINVLDEENFKEEKIKTIEPWEKRINGVHTLNHDHKLTFLDAKWKIKRE